jgi:hypothetical protein
LDEVGYYCVEGMALMCAQATSKRSLGNFPHPIVVRLPHQGIADGNIAQPVFQPPLTTLKRRPVPALDFDGGRR